MARALRTRDASFLMRSSIGQSDEREVIWKMSTQFTYRSKSTSLPITPDEQSAQLRVSTTEPDSDEYKIVHTTG